MLSWGRNFRFPHTVHKPFWRSDVPRILESGPVKLAYGMGRSYGDSCLNEGGDLIFTRGLDRLISADWQEGLITCEAGVTLGELLSIAVPHGWMVPVTPGTKFVTVGGAIANDVHGKNHHAMGTFGCHVEAIDILRSTGERISCSPTQQAELFAATIGGLGLTGFITTATLRLRRGGPFITQEAIRFANLEAFLKLAAESDAAFEYTVAWVDMSSRGSSMGRGVFFRGNLSEQPRDSKVHRDTGWPVPLEFPQWVLNRYTVAAFNQVYHFSQGLSADPKIVHYDPFFYPLDRLHHWNRIYGPKGFFQYQCVVPYGRERDLESLLEIITKAGAASFLVVLKTFGEGHSPGLLSFPMAGYTLALDFINQGPRTAQLFQALDAVVARAGGRLYPAKDSHMNRELFVSGYPQLERFKAWRDQGFSSSFWRRVMGED